MSHVFISYKREDADKRDSLIDALKSEDIPYWYDVGIEGGELWLETINQNLEQSFAIAVILTNNSLKSHYITYEWSWGKGYGIEVIPLQFENMPSDFTGHPLSQIQSINCKDSIPASLIQKLKYLQKDSPLDRYVKLRISDLLMPFRILSRFSLLLHPFMELEIVNFEIFLSFIQKTLVETENLYFQKLPELWLSSSHAFTTKQKRKYEELFVKIHGFEEMLRDIEIALDRYGFAQVISADQIENLEELRIDLEDSFLSFHSDLETFDLRHSAFHDFLEQISEALASDSTFRYGLTFADSAKDALWRYMSNENAKVMWGILENMVKPTSKTD